MLGRVRALPGFAWFVLALVVAANAQNRPSFLESSSARFALSAPQQDTAAPSKPAAFSNQAEASAGSERPVLVIETSKGIIKVELFPEQALETVGNFLQYAEEGFYNDTIFHRVERGKLIQGGGFTPELEAKPTREPIKNESHDQLRNVRGTIAMARRQAKDSATSQFYINVGNNPEFDRCAKNFGYTVFGRVIEGMNVVDRISKVQTSRRGRFKNIPILPVLIESMQRAEVPDHSPP